MADQTPGRQKNAVAKADVNSLKLSIGSEESAAAEKKLLSNFEMVFAKQKEPTSLKFIRIYCEEDSEIAADFWREATELKQLVDETWKSVYIPTILLACESCGTREKIGTKKQIRSCTKIAKLLMDRMGGNENFYISLTSRWKDLKNLGKDFASNEKCLHSIVALFAAATLHKLREHGDESVAGIQTCLWLMTFAVQAMVDYDPSSASVVSNHVIPVMYKTLAYMKEVRTARAEFRYENEAWGLLRISLTYHFAGEEERCLKEAESGITLVRKRFKSQASSLQVFGALFNNAAAAYERLGRSEIAHQLFYKALKAYKTSTDWGKSYEKGSFIRLVSDNLKIYEESNQRSCSEVTEMASSTPDEAEV